MNLNDPVEEAHIKIAKATKYIILALETIEDCQDSIKFWNKQIAGYYEELDNLQKKEGALV